MTCCSDQREEPRKGSYTKTITYSSEPVIYLRDGGLIRPQTLKAGSLLELGKKKRELIETYQDEAEVIRFNKTVTIIKEESNDPNEIQEYRFVDKLANPYLISCH